jgi:hypothetical protein
MTYLSAYVRPQACGNLSFQSLSGPQACGNFSLSLSSLPACDNLPFSLCPAHKLTTTYPFSLCPARMPSASLFLIKSTPFD